MEAYLTPANITFVLGIMGVIFTVYNYFRKPQEDIEKRQAVSESEVDGKAALLAQSLRWEKEATEKRFKEMQDSIKESTTMAQNHIHTIDTKLTTHMENSNNWHLNMTTEITKLATIINERIPQK